MKIQSEYLNGLLKKEDMYQLKVGGICVEMAYSEKNKSIYECMLNILKVKIK